MTLTYTLSEINTAAQEILSSATSNILAFYGEMGIGKTTLIKEICKELGVKETTSSPTFSIVNEYTGANGKVIYHFDCYRIENPSDILDIGFDDYLESGDWVFIEWPDKVFDHLPKNTMKVQISEDINGCRSIFLKKLC